MSMRPDSRAVTGFLISLMFLWLVPAMASAGSSDEETVTVQGTGYPPIRAESTAQAHLMARRAAVVDAYRNAVSGGTSHPGPDVTYQELSGFVSGMKIVGEEYLSDGGIRITARVPKDEVVPLPGVAVKTKRGAERRGPGAVSRDEWYKIIHNLVRIEK